MIGSSVGRNDPCPCGSGKKFKRCCLAKTEEARRVAAQESAAHHQHQCDDPSHHHGPHDHEHSHDDGHDHGTGHVHGPGCDHDHDFDDEDDDSAPLDPIWDALADQSLETRCALTLARIQDGTPFDADNCVDLINSLGIELLQLRRAPELEALLEATRLHRPQLVEDFGAFDRALRAWIALSRQGDDSRLLEMAEHFDEDPEELLQLLDAYRYHGRLGVVGRAVQLALESVTIASDERPELLHELHEVAAQTALAEALDANPSLDPHEPGLLERLSAFGEVDASFLGELVSRRTGRGIEPLPSADLLAVKSLEAAEQMTFLLSLEFCGCLVRDHTWTRSRAEMARAELAAYLTERMLDIGKPDGRGTKQALRGVPKRAGYLIPDAATAATHLELSADPVLGSVHRAAALLAALPLWVDFLATRGLIEADEGRQLVARIRSAAHDLPEVAEVFCEDPDVLDDLRVALAP